MRTHARPSTRRPLRRMSDDQPERLKVISSGTDDDSLRALWPALLGSCAVIVLVIIATQADCRGAYHSVGPGSAAYKACAQQLRTEFPRYDLESVEKEAIGDSAWSIRFGIVPLWDDNSPKAPAVRRCNYENGTATLVEF